jgi:hypothetical protein
MGAYLNPPDTSKEEWLAKNAKSVSRDELAKFLGEGWKDLPAGQLPVALVDNGAFSAAGIAYKEPELQVHLDPSDGRPMRYFLVEREKLYAVSNLKDYLPANPAKGRTDG